MKPSAVTPKGTPKPGTERVVEFIARTTSKDIPAEAIAVAKNAFLDWLGVTIAGSRDRSVNIMAEYVKKLGGQNEATAICQGFKTTAESAALLNGTMSHALDFDDTVANSVHYNLHPSVGIFPAVLALAEKQNLAGRDVLTSYIVGMEVVLRIGIAIGQLIPATGWHSTQVMGTMAAVAASANALGLNPAQAQNALGIAASLAGGFMRNTGTMTKPMHAGNAARSGVIAASLAAGGFTANSNILDDRLGYCHMFGSGQATGLMGAERDLGKEWQLAAIGLGFKPYPACRSTHASIDATLYLRKKYKISADQVAGIVCKISPIHTQFCRFFQPKTAYEGKFSINYCVATALRNGKVVLEDFTDERVNDPEAQSLLSKVSFLYPEGWAEGAVNLRAEIVIKLKNGKQYSHRVALPKGEPENPMTEEEMAAKFENCCRVALSKKETQKTLDLIRHFEEVDDLSQLYKVLGKTYN